MKMGIALGPKPCRHLEQRCICYCTITCTYDALGRLTGETVTAGADITATAYTYNNLNQVTQAGDITYTYSDAGNLVSQNQSGILIASYTYDSQNRMVEAKTYGISGTLTETYNYDALGNRIAKTTDGV